MQLEATKKTVISKLAVGEKPKPGWCLVGVSSSSVTVQQLLKKLQDVNSLWTRAIPLLESQLSQQGWQTELPRANFFKHPVTGVAGFFPRKYWDEKSKTFFMWVNFVKVGA
jgi:hypothetical protein